MKKIDKFYDSPNGYDKDGLYKGDIRHFQVITDKFDQSRQKGGKAHSNMINKRKAWELSQSELVAEIVKVREKIEGLKNVLIEHDSNRLKTRLYWEAIRLSDYQYTYSKRFSGGGLFRRV